ETSCAVGGRFCLGRHSENNEDDCGSALHPFGCRAHVLDARRRRLIRAEGSSGLAECRLTAVWDCRIRVRAAARTLCGGIGIFPEDRTEDRVSRIARGKVTVAG